VSGENGGPLADRKAAFHETELDLVVTRHETVLVILGAQYRCELGAGLSTVKGQRTVEATDVAHAIAATIIRPRFETWVPRTAHWMYLFMSVLPKKLSDALSRMVGASDVLARPDSNARADYEAKFRST
jgi:hypothetical protein